MTNDNFTDAARAEAERVARENTPLEYGSIWDAFVDAYAAGLQARDHLAAQEPTDAEVRAAAFAVLALDGDRGLDGFTYSHIARAALSAARAARRDEGDR